MILAIDPGLMTGWAIWNSGSHQFTSGQEDFEGFAYTLEEAAHHIELYIVERYTINADTAKKSPQPEALEVTGMVRYFATMERTPMLMQSPSEAIGFATDDRLREVGWYRPGKGHANDAARHLFLYFVKQEMIYFYENENDILVPALTL